MATTIDVPVAVRGASAGFSVLLLGTLLAQVVAAFVPKPIGVALVMLTVIAGFMVAARHSGDTPAPPIQGALSAVLAYLLVLPLQWHFGRPELQEIAFTIAAAVAVGALTPFLISRTRLG